MTINIKAGIKKILNINCFNFSDWNTNPRMGRNVFMNINYAF
jgi:hypothetical protein